MLGSWASLGWGAFAQLQRPGWGVESGACAACQSKAADIAWASWWPASFLEATLLSSGNGMEVDMHSAILAVTMVSPRLGLSYFDVSQAAF